MIFFVIGVMLLPQQTLPLLLTLVLMVITTSIIRMIIKSSMIIDKDDKDTDNV